MDWAFVQGFYPLMNTKESYLMAKKTSKRESELRCILFDKSNFSVHTLKYIPHKRNGLMALSRTETMEMLIYKQTCSFYAESAG